MQFYSSSTGTMNTKQELKSQSLFTSFKQVNPAEPSQTFLVYYYNNYYQQFCTLSAQLNHELTVNNRLIEMKSSAENAQQPCQEAVVSEGQKATGQSSKNASQIEQASDSKLNKKKPPKKKANKADNGDSDSYQPDDDSSKDIAIAQSSQSKNVPKNYGKAIIAFIQRHQDFTKKVVQHFNIDLQEFSRILEKAKRSLNTIRQLRSLWLDEQNRFAKAFRVFTIEYLRKHSLPYIFNSRVENFHKHIKYRFKMVESVKDPRNFTHMKDF